MGLAKYICMEMGQYVVNKAKCSQKTYYHDFEKCVNNKKYLREEN